MHNRLKLLGLMAVATVVVTTQSYAADVPFDATVTSSCTLNLDSGGTFGIRGDRRRLGSGLPGGTHGFANVVTGGPGFTLSAIIPSSFNSEPTADLASPEDFSIRWWGTGATSFTSNQIDTFTAADREPLNEGTTNIRLRLAAQKPGGLEFAPGNYSASVTLTCSS